VRGPLSRGIEFDAPDGERSRLIFLILTPSEDDGGAQLEILADISRTFLDSNLREGGLRVNSFTEFVALLRTRESRSPKTAPRRQGGRPVIDLEDQREVGAARIHALRMRTPPTGIASDMHDAHSHHR
jgi:hypothetical protein